MVLLEVKLGTLKYIYIMSALVTSLDIVIKIRINNIKTCLFWLTVEDTVSYSGEGTIAEAGAGSGPQYVHWQEGKNNKCLCPSLFSCMQGQGLPCFCNKIF